VRHRIDARDLDDAPGSRFVTIIELDTGVAASRQLCCACVVDTNFQSVRRRILEREQRRAGRGHRARFGASLGDDAIERRRQRGVRRGDRGGIGSGLCCLASGGRRREARLGRGVLRFGGCQRGDRLIQFVIGR
jgi:hypothetical protein